MTGKFANLTLAREFLMLNGTAKSEQVLNYLHLKGNLVKRCSANTALNHLVERGEATKEWTGKYNRSAKQFIYKPTALIGTLPQLYSRVPSQNTERDMQTPEGVLMLQSIMGNMSAGHVHQGQAL